MFGLGQSSLSLEIHKLLTWQDGIVQQVVSNQPGLAERLDKAPLPNQLDYLKGVQRKILESIAAKNTALGVAISQQPAPSPPSTLPPDMSPPPLFPNPVPLTPSSSSSSSKMPVAVSTPSSSAADSGMSFLPSPSVSDTRPSSTANATLVPDAFRQSVVSGMSDTDRQRLGLMSDEQKQQYFMGAYKKNIMALRAKQQQQQRCNPREPGPSRSGCIWKAEELQALVNYVHSSGLDFAMVSSHPLLASKTPQQCQERFQELQVFAQQQQQMQQRLAQRNQLLQQQQQMAAYQLLQQQQQQLMQQQRQRQLQQWQMQQRQIHQEQQRETRIEMEHTPAMESDVEASDMSSEEEEETQLHYHQNTGEWSTDKPTRRKRGRPRKKKKATDDDDFVSPISTSSMSVRRSGRNKSDVDYSDPFAFLDEAVVQPQATTDDTGTQEEEWKGPYERLDKVLDMREVEVDINERRREKLRQARVEKRRRRLRRTLKLQQRKAKAGKRSNIMEDGDEEEEEDSVSAFTTDEDEMVATEGSDSDDEKDDKDDVKRYPKKTQKQEQFLIKISGESYVHCSWMAKWEMEERFGEKSVRPRIRNLKKSLSQMRAVNSLMWDGDAFCPLYKQVERIVSHRRFETVDMETRQLKKIDMVLVKWSGGLSYSEATWEEMKDLDDSAEMKLAQHRRFNVVPHDTQPRKLKVSSSKAHKWYEGAIKFKNDNQLRSYQLEGLNWLISRFLQGKNCILADEMGLGKTVQSVSFLEHLRLEHNCRPFLVVAPLSTVGHWKREAEGWTDMNVVLYHDSAEGREFIRRHEFFHKGTRVPKFHMLITTYEIILSDIDHLERIPFFQLIVDEGHRLKNRDSKLTEMFEDMDIQRRLLLTGTPIHNSIEELWNLLHFLEPEEFDNWEHFNREYGTLEEADQVDKLKQRIGPYILRRLKDAVEKSIPKKVEMIIDIELTTLQKQYYRALYERNREFLVRGATKDNLPNLLNCEMQLRKCCNHAFLIDGVEETEVPAETTHKFYFDKVVESSGKMVLLDKLLPKLKKEGHKVLLFTQMKRMLDLLTEYLQFHSYKFERLDGSSKAVDRQMSIDRFSKPDSDRFIFLLTTRAGGVGLNLAAADTVIIYDSDWNPQMDVQAQARCHRIGQTRPVTVYRLVTKNTYESEMFERASKKLGLEKAVMSSMEKKEAVPEAERSALEKMLKHGAYSLLEGEEDTSKKFTEADIDDILKNSTHIISSEGTGEGEGALSNLAFTRTQFESSEADTSIQVDDPDFWDKILALGDGSLASSNSAAKLLTQLTDQSAMVNAESKKAFFAQLQESAENAVQLKQEQMAIPNEDNIIALLETFTTLSRAFSLKQITQSRRWLKTLKTRSRKRVVRDTLTMDDLVMIRKQRNARKKRSRSRRDEDEDAEVDEEEEEEESDSDADQDQEDDDSGSSSSSSSDGEAQVIRPKLWKGEVCAECAAGGRLAFCGGYCRRMLHAHCAGTTEETFPQEQKPKKKSRKGSSAWLCPGCSEGEHHCFVCGEKGAEEGDVDSGVFNCSQTKCGYFYHLRCMRQHPKAKFFTNSDKFRCPVHYCSECDEANKQYTLHCHRCPTAYHLRCLPPDSIRLNKTVVFCPECAEDARLFPHYSAALQGADKDLDETPLNQAVAKPTRSQMVLHRQKQASSQRKKTGGKSSRFSAKVYNVHFSMREELVHTCLDVPLFFPKSAHRKRKTALQEALDRRKEQGENDDAAPPTRKRHKRSHHPEEEPPDTVQECLDRLPYSFTAQRQRCWCRYCGAMLSEEFGSSPWGDEKLCKTHHQQWKASELDLPPQEPEDPIDRSSFTELKYLQAEVTKRVADCRKEAEEPE